MNKEKPSLLNLFIIIMVVNAALTGIHYILIFQGLISLKGMDIAEVREFAIADTFAIIIPSVLGAIGLWQLKEWGIALAVLLSGGYIHGVIALISRAVISQQFNMMSIVSVYFILFSLSLVTYLWQRREVFAR